MNRTAQYWIAWLLFATVAAAVAMLFQTAAFVDGQYIPVSNDSFYHARRIIDAAIGERGFYEFDTMIHVPEGSWVNWPWGYDYGLAMALRLALLVAPGMQPMQFLAFVPVAWVFVNAGLLTMICRNVGLSPLATGIGLLVFALSPLTQNLHGLGLIDHHFIELTFVLATVYTGLRFFGGRAYGGIAIGAVLGAASAFHNGLFILQAPVLATVFLLWLEGHAPVRRELLAFAMTLVATTLLAVLPSAPFRDLQFEFWTLSWFHLYVATGSAVALAFFALRDFSRGNLALLAAVALTGLSPLIAKLAVGTAFLSGELDVISDIQEVASPLARLFEPAGLAYVGNLYSGLFLLAPPLAILHVVRVVRERDPTRRFLSLMIVFGIVLMLLQYRLHPFGFWAVLVGGLLTVEALRARLGASTLVTTAATLAIVAIALQPPLRNQLFKRVPPGMNRDYAASRSMFPQLASACARRPGAVLSYGDDGHPIRYHTDCSVISNNFLMTPFHRQKILEADGYLQMSPAQLVDAAPHIRYVFVRMFEIFESGPDGVVAVPVEAVRQRNAPLFVALTFSAELPSEYRLIDELRVEDARDFAFVRVFEIVRN